MKKPQNRIRKKRFSPTFISYDNRQKQFVSDLETFIPKG